MPKKILVADDNAMVRKSLCRIFETEENYDLCAEAVNGQEAIALAKQHKPDLIVLDFQMPVMNGIDAARTLLAKDRNTRIIILSAMLTPLHLEACLSVGVVDCIPKEKLYAELVPAIRRAAVHQ